MLYNASVEFLICNETFAWKYKIHNIARSKYNVENLKWPY